jgi:hypothetical protein
VVPREAREGDTTSGSESHSFSPSKSRDFSSGDPVLGFYKVNIYLLYKVYFVRKGFL